MRHTREEVVERATREFELLDQLVANLNQEDWERLLPRPETKDPWTIKDALAHITFWKANTARSLRKLPRPPEQRGLKYNDENHFIYMRWRDRPPLEDLAWHRQVQQDLLVALREAPDGYFSGKERNPQWPFDIDGHSLYHRVKDIERTLPSNT